MRDARRWFLSVAVLAFASSAVLTPQAHEQLTSGDPSVFRGIARQQNPIVVAIKTTRWVDPATDEEADWYERLFGRAFSRGPQRQREIASGILISPDGDILTNDHVVADVDLVEVRLLGHETTTYRATVVGRDPASDTAVIRLVGGPSNLPVATLGDSDALEIGDWVMAIGNPYQLGHTATVGIVSYVGRGFEISEGHWQKLIQTDASINPGSSGGPLLNARGEVIGISLAMLADELGETMGIGFAVPINIVKAALPGLRAGRVIHGTIGVRLRQAVLSDSDARALGLPSARGALITSVERRSSGDEAGLRPGDVVVEFLGTPVDTAGDLMTRVSSARPGVRARAVVLRDGRRRAIDIAIRELPLPPPRNARHIAASIGDLGLTLADATPAASSRPVEGSIVKRVEDGSIAATADIEPGDVIRRINQQTIRTAAEAVHELQRIPAGSTVFLLIWRDGEERLIEIETE